MQELDRLGPGVDLSAYHDETGASHEVAFKFNPWGRDRRLQNEWNEINLLTSLPPHQNILPFDRVVLEDVESRVIGFTTKYVTGGTLENPKLPFRFKWLQQLTQLVDFLNLDLGIMHQDIAPRNLLFDSETQNILLFDFDWVACGKRNLRDGRDDVTGVVYTLYELITGDSSFVNIPHRQRSMEMVQNISEWICNRELDADLSTFRNFLNDWVTTRRSDDDMQRYLNAPHQLQWPDLPTPTDLSVPYEGGTTADGKRSWITGRRLMRTALEKGQYVFRWDRQPQRRLESPEILISSRTPQPSSSGNLSEGWA